MPLSDMSSPPLRIELRASLTLRVGLLLLAVLATIALWLSNAPTVSLLLVPGLLAFAWPRRVASGWRELVLRSDGTAIALDGGGEELVIVPCRLQRRGLLTVITCEAQGGMRSHLFTPDTLDSGERRRLQLWFARHVSATDEPGVQLHV